ncbi:hypothetical protein WJX72_001440 [[Myrmecia] bisecta]|uniref:Uncharacterized protein n=1 Tax=[Myrmecia] bisecta TaxID=41462 RepID=A0AAW1PTM2_9CHLO
MAWPIPAGPVCGDNTETPGVPASTLQRGSSNRDVLAEEAGDVSAKPELPKQPKVPSKRRSPSPARHVNDNAVITARLRSLEDIQLVEHDSTASSLAPRQQDQVPQQGPERIPSSPVPPLNLGFTGRSPSSDPRSSGSVGANHALHTASNKQPSVGNLLATLQHLNLNQRLREPLEHVSTAVQAAKSWQDKVAALQKDPDTREKKLGSREDVRWEVWRLRAANEQLQKHSSELASKLAAQNSGSPAHEKENKLKPQASLSPQRLSLSPQRASLGPQHSAPSPAKSVGSSSGPASNWLKATQVGKPRPATADSPAAASPESAAYYTRENEQLKAWISELQSANTRLEQERAQAQLKIEDLSRELLRAKQDMSELRITQAPRSDSLPRENSLASAN